MKTLYLDTSWGISGDHLHDNIKKMNLDGYEIRQEEIIRGGFRANRFIVEIENEHKHRHDHEDHRDLNDILEILSSSSLSAKIKTKAEEMFRLLAKAEAFVHKKKMEEIHFHEVGALDSIIDIVGSCIAFDYFGADRIVCWKTNLGGGFVNTSHGKLSVPPPAVAELCKGIPVFSDGSEMELTTPTGALILRSFVTDFASMPPIKLERMGCGAGTREIGSQPNMLRIFLGETENPPAIKSDKISVLETEIDDMQGENFGHIMDRLFALPVLDVFFIPVQMKKNRPGTLLTVLVEPNLLNKAAELILKETTTFGVRFHETSRIILERKSIDVQTSLGNIRVKLGIFGDDIIKASPEYEDCRNAAIKHNVPLKDVQAEALNKYYEQEKKP
jgi:uncharacterized protein (TIGR00299 family) protein